MKIHFCIFNKHMTTKMKKYQLTYRHKKWCGFFLNVDSFFLKIVKCTFLTVSKKVDKYELFDILSKNVKNEANTPPSQLAEEDLN